ncbi:unnamed protein product, partial [Ectocarpus sp. 12 AP-2014]
RRARQENSSPAGRNDLALPTTVNRPSWKGRRKGESGSKAERDVRRESLASTPARWNRRREENRGMAFLQAD